MGLFPKNQLANWYVKKGSGASGSRWSAPLIRVYFTQRRHTVTVSEKLLKHYEIPLKDGNLRIALDLDSDQKIVVFWPTEGVPFVTLKIRDGAKSPHISCKDLASRFLTAFGLSKRCSYYDFEVERLQSSFGMTPYQLKLVNKECD